MMGEDFLKGECFFLRQGVDPSGMYDTNKEGSRTRKADLRSSVRLVSKSLLCSRMQDLAVGIVSLEK